MITVEEASKIIEGTIKDFGTEKVHIDHAIGRVLREDFYADRDFPPYDRVTMDGIAIDATDFKPNQIYPIEAIAPAGAIQKTLLNDQHCLEVMTGSILPKAANTVIRYEDLEISNGAAKVCLDELKLGKNVHRKGEDRKAGERVVTKGCQISPAEIGVAATIGKAQIEVSKLPKCIIISTGDELVKVDQNPEPHQIRRSNVHRLKATLKAYNIDADTEHLDDDLEQVKDRLKEILQEYEVILLSGGVSKGKFDYLPEAMNQLGVEKLFHRIKQRPGKPFWFGKYADGPVIFAFPGNPVSSFMCTHIYFTNWLRACLGLKPQPSVYGVLENDLHFKPDLVYFAQVKISYSSTGQLMANPILGNGSGDLANLVDADAFMRIPRGKDIFKKGEIYPLYFYR